ncbi:MAG: hypothetical protein K1X78_10915 [Verrucomicrobiaceae bacterium]|nr:hypothetical protein [Verrucomicrobiaceae bacterium]
MIYKSPEPISPPRFLYSDRSDNDLVVCNIGFDPLHAEQRGFPGSFKPLSPSLDDLHLARWLVIGGAVGLTCALFQPAGAAVKWGAATFLVLAVPVFAYRLLEYWTLRNENQSKFHREISLWKTDRDAWMCDYLKTEVEDVRNSFKTAANAYTESHRAVMVMRRQLPATIDETADYLDHLESLLRSGEFIAFWDQADKCHMSLDGIAAGIDRLADLHALHDEAFGKLTDQMEVVQAVFVAHRIDGGGDVLTGCITGQVEGWVTVLPDWHDQVSDQTRTLRARFAGILSQAHRSPDFVAVLQRRMILNELVRTQDVIRQEFRLLASTITSAVSRICQKIDDSTSRLETAMRESADRIARAVHSAASSVSTQIAMGRRA